MIPEEILKVHNAAAVSLAKGEVLFREGDTAHAFYLVHSGKIRMINYNEDGKEFVQGFFTAGQSFGEPPFFTSGTYPASAEAVEESVVWKIPRESFLKLLREHFDIHLGITEALSARLVYKSMMLSELAIEEAEHRLTTLINHLLEQAERHGDKSKKLAFTRQQLADMTGLRVETVIRSIKSLEQRRFLEIDDEGKIIWRHSGHRSSP